MRLTSSEHKTQGTKRCSQVLYFKIIIIFNYVYMYVYLWACDCKDPCSPEKDIKLPGAGVLGGYGPPNMGTGNQNLDPLEEQECMLLIAESAFQPSLKKITLATTAIKTINLYFCFTHKAYCHQYLPKQTENSANICDLHRICHKYAWQMQTASNESCEISVEKHFCLS